MLIQAQQKIMISADLNNNYYSPTDFDYNVNRFPNLHLAYNTDDKLLVGFGVLRRTYGFRKQPFAI